jgi:hypothetical protein
MDYENNAWVWATFSPHPSPEQLDALCDKVEEYNESVDDESRFILQPIRGGLIGPEGLIAALEDEINEFVEQLEQDEAGQALVRLAHCTPTIGEHSPLCNRDGQFCSLAFGHKGECQPHGG